MDPSKARDRSKQVGNKYCTNCAFRPESGKSVQICFLHVCVISVRWRAACALAGPGKARACCALTRDGSAWSVISGPVLRVARARWWRVVAPLVALVGPVVARGGATGGAEWWRWWARWWPRCRYPPPLPARLDARCAFGTSIRAGQEATSTRTSWRASRQARRSVAARFVVAVDAGRAPFARLCGPWLPGCTLADHPSCFVRGLDTRLCAVSLLAWVVLGLLGVSFRAGR